MYSKDTEVIFPARVINELADQRGEQWQLLVREVLEHDEKDIEFLGFILLMVRLNNCTTCEAGSYRAIRGCLLCAQQSVKRFRGNDQELSQLYNKAKVEVENFHTELKNTKAKNSKYDGR